ncbi:MAG: sigma-70 family RNA polymerase sigma factor [Bacteroidetes bacterium]|nr:MAG: sigma-70 family RNA polymerase sigma factor [Bacteroidota bacterium]
MQAEDRIIELMREKDQRAIPLIHKKYSRALLGVVLHIVKDQETAEDVLQEALVKIWRNSDQYDPSKGRLFTWLLNVARNTAIDKIRSKAYRQQAANIRPDENFVSEQGEGYSIPVDHIGLKELLLKLDPRQQEVIQVVYFGGRTHQEAAEELDVPLGTLKTRIRMALTQLRKYL